MRVHFIGIGGIGMSGLALIALQKNYEVSGSDLKQSKITEKLMQAGAKLFFSHDEKNISADMVIVVTTAIKKENPEYQAALKIGCKIVHRSDFLLQMMEGKKQIMVSGAHGKTTTTALLAHIFKKAGLNPSYAVGGLIPNQPHAFLDQGDYFIFEGDESDGSFLNTNPIAVVLTNIDQEHLDYWKTFEELFLGFKRVIEKVGNHSFVFYSYEDPYLSEMASGSTSYGLSPNAEFKADNISFSKEGMEFDIVTNQERIAAKIPLFGLHNVKNALGCFALASFFGISSDAIVESMKTFKGVGRRFEILGKMGNTVFVDDYAHHPVEMGAVFSVLENISDLKRVLVVFQPHRYSRLQDLLKEFVRSLSKPFDVVALPVYSAGEDEIPLLYENFLDAVRPNQLIRLELNQVSDYLDQNYQKYDWVITIGAGNVTDVGRNFLNCF